MRCDASQSSATVKREKVESEIADNEQERRRGGEEEEEEGGDQDQGPGTRYAQRVCCCSLTLLCAHQTASQPDRSSPQLALLSIQSVLAGSAVVLLLLFPPQSSYPSLLVLVSYPIPSHL